MESPAAQLSQKLSRDAEAVCRAYLSNGRKHGRYWLVGDVQNTPGRSLYVRLTGPDRGQGAAGKWTDAATGEHGDLLDLIALNLNFNCLRDTLEEARRFLSLPRPDPPSRNTQQKAATGSPEAARRLWEMGKPIAGTLAERYLASRGLVGVENMASLRFHPNCFYWRDGQPPDTKPETWPALLAKVTDNHGTLTGVHRTWLNPHTATKAPLDPNRKAMGKLLSHAVRFGQSTNIMTVGEGLETMLSLRMALPALPPAAALSGNHLAAFEPPASLRRLYLAGDNDPAGRAAATALTDRIAAKGIETIPLHPRCADFNDDLRNLGLDAVRANLRSQLAPVDLPRLLESTTS
tara:strand:- start:18267 stop:19313 length:1047 start_codon:yes stop_codon:yes gene_type:complete